MLGPRRISSSAGPVGNSSTASHSHSGVLRPGTSDRPPALRGPAGWIAFVTVSARPCIDSCVISAPHCAQKRPPRSSTDTDDSASEPPCAASPLCVYLSDCSGTTRAAERSLDPASRAHRHRRGRRHHRPPTGRTHRSPPVTRRVLKYGGEGRASRGTRRLTDPARSELFLHGGPSPGDDLAG